MSKMFIMGQAWAQVHGKPTTHEQVVPSLPVCSNPVLKHFLPARLPASAWQPLTLSLRAYQPLESSSLSLLPYGVTLIALSFAWSYQFYFIFSFDCNTHAYVVEHPELEFELHYLTDS